MFSRYLKILKMTFVVKKNPPHLCCDFCSAVSQTTNVWTCFCFLWLQSSANIPTSSKLDRFADVLTSLLSPGGSVAKQHITHSGMRRGKGNNALKGRTFHNDWESCMIYMTGFLSNQFESLVVETNHLTNQGTTQFKWEVKSCNNIEGKTLSLLFDYKERIENDMNQSSSQLECKLTCLLRLEALKVAVVLSMETL